MGCMVPNIIWGICGSRLAALFGCKAGASCRTYACRSTMGVNHERHDHSATAPRPPSAPVTHSPSETRAAPAPPGVAGGRARPCGDRHHDACRSPRGACPCAGREGRASASCIPARRGRMRQRRVSGAGAGDSGTAGCPPGMRKAGHCNHATGGGVRHTAAAA